MFNHNAVNCICHADWNYEYEQPIPDQYWSHKYLTPITQYLGFLFFSLAQSKNWDRDGEW